MSNNIFSGRRFRLLFKQHFIHNAQFLLLATVAYFGVIFIVLSVVQFGNEFAPHRLENFQGFLIAFSTVFGILYAGYAFPAFRSKESTIHYLMLPASVLEKFVFEFVSRIGIIILLLPLLYWVAFNIQGYFFAIFSDEVFEFIGVEHLVRIEMPDDYRFLIYSLITGGVLFVLSLAFTGAAMFTKQPLVKTLFSVALVVMFFLGYSYVVITSLGIDKYNPSDSMLFVPLEEDNVMTAFCVALFVATLVMLVVSFRKLKERQV